MKNKIVFILPGLPAPIGGFKYVYHHASVLAKNNYDVTVVHVNPWLNYKSNNIFKRLRSYIIFAYFLHFSKWRNLPQTDYGVNFKTYNRINITFNPNIQYVIASWQLLNYYSAIINYNSFNVMHYCMDIPGFMGPQTDVINSFFFPVQYVAISKFMLQTFRTYNKSHIINYMPCSVTKIPIENSVNRVIDICGNLTAGKYKNILFAIELFNALSLKYNITLYGRARRPTSLNSRIRYLSSPTDSDISSLLSLALSFICVSKFEGFGLPGLEAMSHSVIVLSTDTGGCRDYCFFGENCILLSGSSINNDLNVIDKFFKDRESMNTIRRNADLFIANYSKTFNDKRILALFSSPSSQH